MDKHKLFTWYASLRWVKGEGYIPPSETFNYPSPKNYVVLNDIDNLNEERLKRFFVASAYAVNPEGFLCVGCSPSIALPELPGFKKVEDTQIEGRRFAAFQKTDGEPLQLALPDIIVFRDGHAHGDALQASAVAEYYARKFPDKKVCLMVRENAVGTVKNTPNVGIVKIEGCIRNEDIPHFTEFWTLRCGLFINLDWSVEGCLLKYLGTRDYFWSLQQRAEICDANYNESVKKIAGMDEPLRIKYYPSKEEEEFAEKEKPSNSYISVQLRGSAVHKWYPFWPDLIIQFLSQYQHDIVLLGDATSKVLELEILEKVKFTLGNTDRIKSFVEKCKVGESVEIARRAACVIGPETGVLLALHHEETPKVMIISQSSYGNFNDGNNLNMVRGDTHCSPCHRHHNDFSYCFQDQKTGASLCQAAIPVAMIMKAVDHALRMVQPTHQCSAPSSEVEQVPNGHSPEAQPRKTNRGRKPKTSRQADHPHSTTAPDTQNSRSA